MIGTLEENPEPTPVEPPLSADTLDGVLITWRIALLYLAIPATFFLPAFLPNRQLAGTDYSAAGYFFYEFIGKRMAAGDLPTWVPYVFGGLPLHSNPGATYHPIRLVLAAILSPDRVLPALLVLQFAIAGIGMHLFLRALGIRARVATVGAIAFQMTGSVMSYAYAGHDGRIVVATMTPIVFFLIHRGVMTGDLRWFAGLSAAIALAMLSFQLQSVYYLLLAAAAWGVFLLIHERRRLGNGGMLRIAGIGVAAVAGAFMLAAVDVLPFAGYVDVSPRGAGTNRDYAFSTLFSMPPVETLGIAVPEQAGLLGDYQGANPFKLHTEYLGALVVVFLLIGMRLARKDAIWRFMAALGAFMLTICYGGHTPLYRLYYAVLPGTSKFRSPSIAFFVVAFCLVTMATLALDRLAAAVPVDDDRWARIRRAKHMGWPRLMRALLFVSAFALIITGIAAFDGGGPAWGWFRFVALSFTLFLILWLWTRGTLSPRVAGFALASFVVVDLWIIDVRFLATQSGIGTTLAPDDVVQFLQREPPGRIWVFPFPKEDESARYFGNRSLGLRSNYLMHFGMRQAGGEHGNQLQRWNEFLGVDSTTNVIDWHDLVERGSFLNAAGIKYIVSSVRMELFDAERQQPVPGIHLVHQGSAFVYRNDGALPRALVVPNAVRVAGDAMARMRSGSWNPRIVAFVDDSVTPAIPDSGASPTGAASVTTDEPDRMTIRAHAGAPSLLVVTDNYAEGWRATVDGQPTRIVRTNHTFRGIPIAAGEHEVVLEFAPKAFYVGLWVSLVSWAALLGGGAWLARRSVA